MYRAPKKREKRAEMMWDVLYPIIQYILVAIVFFLVFHKIGSVVSGDDLEQNYIARDTALMINTLYASPGQVIYDYPTNISGYGFQYEIDDEKVSVIRPYED